MKDIKANISKRIREIEERELGPLLDERARLINALHALEGKQAPTIKDLLAPDTEMPRTRRRTRAATARPQPSA